MTVRVKKVGKNNVLTVPTEISCSGKDYEVTASKDGTITYVPVASNPFHNKKTLEKYGKFDGDHSGFVKCSVDCGDFCGKH